MPSLQYSPDQKEALLLLESKANLFLTGDAGSGKSTVIQQFLRNSDSGSTVVLASTGAAALLIGGRTFHSFFGLGILEGGPERTIERALRNPLLVRRVRQASLVIIDEISMLNGQTLSVAEAIARKARGNEEPWGALRIVAVGDFSQLPPVRGANQPTDWAFRHEVWARTKFQSKTLSQNHRVDDPKWIEVLNYIRRGECNNLVRSALNARLKEPGKDEDPTRLFARRMDAEQYNDSRLEALPGEEVLFETDYKGSGPAQEAIRKNCPLPEVLRLKPDALVMLRKNDVDGLFVNGSLAYVRDIDKKQLGLELVESGITIEVEPMKFELLDGDGEVIAYAKNFPINLAYGVTIHKAQGATIDSLRLNLTRLWEPGQAYVALSRAKIYKKLFLDRWEPKSIFTDSDVLRFYDELKGPVGKYADDDGELTDSDETDYDRDFSN